MASKPRNKKTPKPSKKTEPKSKSEILVGERVLWYNANDKAAKGTIKWLGKIPEVSEGMVAGVKLDKAFGSSDGTWNRRNYFSCKPKHGLFVDVNGLLKLSEVGDISSDSVSEREEESDDVQHIYVNHSSDEDHSSGGEDQDDFVIAKLFADKLQIAISQGDTKQASSMAKRLANLNINCKISLVTQSSKKERPKKTKGTKRIKLNITVEKDDIDDEELIFSVAENATILELKNIVS